MNVQHQLSLSESRRAAAAGLALTVTGAATAALTDPILAAIVAAGGFVATLAVVRLELTRR
jgi:hypothetical protein